MNRRTALIQVLVLLVVVIVLVLVLYGGLRVEWDL